MQCKRREMARFDLSGRWRSCQGGMVLNAGLANPSVPPTRETPDTPRKRLSRGQASTGRMIKTGGRQWLELEMGATPLLAVVVKRTLSGRVSDSSYPPRAFR